jgi:hypothetical protein
MFPLIEKGRVVRKIDFQGLEISVETDKGEVRRWYDPNSRQSGETTMHFPYGYFCGMKKLGADGDQLDVYVGPDPDAYMVYIVKQMKKPGFTEYDEDKVMIGFESSRQAKNAYLMHYDDERFFGSMQSIPMDEFKSKYLKKALDANVGPMTGDQPLAAQVAQQPEPPPSIEDPQGVDRYLQKIGSMKDKDLYRLASEVWGDGYQANGVTLEQTRAELVGFLLDQRDWFRVLMTSGTQSPMDSEQSPPHSEDSSSNSPTGPETEAGLLQEENSNAVM